MCDGRIVKEVRIPLLLVGQAKTSGQRVSRKAVPLQVVRGSHVVTGDFDGDRRKDLVVGARFVTGYYVACQREEGTFQLRQTRAPSKMYLDIALADVNGDRREAEKWSLDTAEPASGYAAALASPGNPPEVSYWLWPQ